MERPLASVLSHLGVLTTWRHVFSLALDGFGAVGQRRDTLRVGGDRSVLTCLLESLPLVLRAVHGIWLSDVQVAVLLGLPLGLRPFNSHGYFGVTRLRLLRRVETFRFYFARHAESG